MSINDVQNLIDFYIGSNIFTEETKKMLILDLLYRVK